MDVVAPDVILGTRVHQRDLERMHRNNTTGPGGRHATFSDGHLQAKEILRVELISAPARRLQRQEKPGLLQCCYVFCRDATLTASAVCIVPQQGL